MKKHKIISVCIVACIILFIFSGCSLTGNNADVQVDINSYAYLVSNSTLQYPATNSTMRYNVYTKYVTISEVISSNPHITIPDTIENLPVIAIEDGAFENCDTVKSVSIGNKVMVIGNRAFANCKNLEIVEIPSSAQQLGENVFYQCTSLKSVVIPRGVAVISRNAFYGCTSLASVTIQESSVSNRIIDASAFGNCNKLKYVWLPQDVVQINDSAFPASAQELTVYGYAASAAAQYSAKYKINYVVLNGSLFSQMVATNASMLPEYPSIGKSLSSTYWQITLNDVEYRNVINDVVAGEGNKFAIIHFSVTNISNSPKYFNGLFASGSAGGSFRPLKFAKRGELTLDFLSGTVLPDTVLQGYLIYEVKNNFKYITINFSQLAGFESLDATFAVYGE